MQLKECLVTCLNVIKTTLIAVVGSYCLIEILAKHQASLNRDLRLFGRNLNQKLTSQVSRF